MYGKTNIESLILKTGDELLCYKDSIVISFKGKRKVLSTSSYNGGYSEDLTAVYNHDLSLNKTKPCNLIAKNYNEYMRNISLFLGLNPEKVSGMGTTAQMKNASVISMSYEKLTVSAIVTGGIETNAGRAGDAAEFCQTCEKPLHGTINIMLVIDADMSKGAVTRALVTCTEAKTAALQELMADSRFSNGLATGTGTDLTIIVVNANSPDYYESAGKHSKIGELIGKTVITAVKEAISKQGQRTFESEHNLMRRIRRFGVTEESVFLKYKELNENLSVSENKFYEILKQTASLPFVFTYGILYIHLIDEYLWKLTNINETRQTASEIIKILSQKLKITEEIPNSQIIESMKEIEYLLVLAVKNKIKKLQSENKKFVRTKIHDKPNEMRCE